MLYRDDQPAAEALHTVSCRLLLDIMPGLETSVIFQDNVRDMLYITSNIDAVNYKRFLNIGPIANVMGHYFQPSLSVCVCVCLSLTGTSTLQRKPILTKLGHKDPTMI